MREAGYRVVPFDAAHRAYLPQPNSPYDIIGRLVPLYDGAGWTFREELLEEKREKTYPDESYDPAAYLDSREKAAFLALLGEERVGSLRLQYHPWNGTVQVEELMVSPGHRGRGVGTMLMDAAVAWSRAAGAGGVFVESQDVNLLACRFYLGYGFRIGGIDTKLYACTEYRDETAIYFYLPKL